MTTEQIAEALELTAKLMELHGENPFKVKALSNAAYKLDKTGLDLEGKTSEELSGIEGIGKGIAGKIAELLERGTTTELEQLISKTPQGVIEMLGIKGIGPKKVALLWKELGIESPGELLYACKENRLIELKGFGEKTQLAIKKAIEFSQANRGKFHFATVEGLALSALEFIHRQDPECKVSLTGDIRRKSIVIEEIEILTDAASVSMDGFENPLRVPVTITTCSGEEFAGALYRTTASPAHLKQLEHLNLHIPAATSSEEEIFNSWKMQFIEPELREGRGELLLAKDHRIPELITESDIKGILHCHSTWSDGMHSIEEMALHCQKSGFEYFGICDHSKSAFYANGLNEERVAQQQEEVDLLNAKLKGIRIFKGIECDILTDGSLDYNESILRTFDFVVASVHSVLRMDIDKATERLIKAIENPYTRILGHPTGRLLLSREGYPLDHKKIIDACAANQVVIELNAHPYRLDIDWTWIPYCMEKGVQISINPDAHERDGISDVKWGVEAARKGMLTAEFCLNAKDLSGFEQWINNKR